LKIAAVTAVRTADPTYRPMLEIPDAAPTCSFETQAVAMEDEGPLARPSPKASTTSGTTNAP
jgi:hypothetical protein